MVVDIHLVSQDNLVVPTPAAPAALVGQVQRRQVVPAAQAGKREQQEEKAVIMVGVTRHQAGPVVVQAPQVLQDL